MTAELFTYSDVQNIGFFTNPNLQDSQLKAMSRREQLMQGAYYYANSDRDEECRKKSADIFGNGTIPLSDKENSAYFLGHAVLLESGYTGSPFQYFLQQNMDLPPDVKDEDTARIHIGNKVLNAMRQEYDARKKAEEELTTVQNELPTHLANLVTDHMWGEGSKRQESINALASIGAWDKMEPSINRARAAFRPLMHRTPRQIQEALEREQLAGIVDTLSDEKGQLDELAVTAFAIAMAKHAESFQSKGESIPDILGATASATGLTFSEFLRRAESAEEKKRLQQRLDLTLAIGDYETADQVGRLIDAKTERIRGIMMNALSTSIAPSEQAGAIAKTIIGLGRLAGDSAIPMAAAIAATSVSRGKGGWAMLGRAFAGWAGGLAASKDSIIDMAVAQAYVEGVDNPEEYGYYAGLGQAAAENIAGVGTSGFMAFKGINRLMTKAAAKATTSKVLSNAYARATLAWAATTGIEGTAELAEEEIGEALGSMLNAMARATGSNVSEQKYEPFKAIKQMKPHQIASMYVFAGALGLGGAAANFAAAQEISTDIGKLKATGYSDEKAREIAANGIETARKIEEVINSDTSTEEKKAQIAAIQDERLAYLGKSFREDVINASEEDINKRLKEENAEFIYRALLALAIRNGLDEQALIDLGYMGAKRQPNGNYLLTYEEKGEGENAQPKLVQKEWTRDQLTGFLTFQRGTDVHMKLRELSGQLMAMQFAEKVASVEELKIQLANLRDIPITELATIMQHEAITPELFKAFAEKEAANIAADIAQGMTRQQAEMEPSKLLPGVARKDVIQTATAAEERKQNAIAKGEIKPGQAVEYPGLNISRLDGSSLVAFFNQKITLPQMLEEMMEARLTQQAKADPELYNKLGTILQSIQNKLKGVRILPKGKTTFSRGDIVEAYSHLAVAEVIANPAYTSHLSQREQAVVQDVLGSVFRAQRYKAIAGAWLNYKESAEGKAYLENGGKDLVDIFSEAGFTFGKHLEAKQATEEQKMKALEARNFLPDFTQETKLLENKAEAEQELAEVNAKEAQEPTVIPANESVTGEEIVITPEQKEAEQAPAVARPDIVELVKALGEARYDVTFFKESIASAQKRIEKWRSQGNEKMIEHEEKSIAYDQQKLEKLPQKIKDLEEVIANYNKSINTPNAALTPEEQLLNKLRTPAATIRDFAIFFSKHWTSEAVDIELGLYRTTQNGEENPAYIIGKSVGAMIKGGSIVTEEQYSNLFLTDRVNEEIVKVAGELVSSTVLKNEAKEAKKYAQILRNNAKRSKGKLTQAQNAGGTLSLPAAPKWPTAPKKKNKHSAKQIVDILASTTSKDKGRYALNYVSQETQDGTVTYVSCDGRRISALSHKSKESNPKILLDPKTAEPAKEQVDYVRWRHVSRFDTPVIKTIDLAPMLALTKLRKRGKYHPTLSSDSATHKLIEIDIAGKHYTLNAAFLREAVEQLAALTKAYGFPSTVQIHDADIFVISATHGGLKWQCCIQPLTEVDGKTEHNIVFSETSSFIRGAGSHVSATEIEKLQKVHEIDEANAQDAERKAAELKQKAKDVAMLEEQLPPMEKHIRQAAGTTRNFSFAKATSLARDFERGNISALMPTIPQQDAKTKWGRDLFERISGLTLPGTPEGNKAMAEQWAAEQAAKGTPFNTSPDSSTSGANFAIQEADNHLPLVKVSPVQTAKEAQGLLSKARGKVYTNAIADPENKVSATISGETLGKVYKAQMSVRNLTRLGYSEAEARKIHYSACTKMHEIFEAATYGFFEDNYDPNNKKGRAGAWHYFGIVEIDGYGKFDVNVTANSPTNPKEGNRLYTLELTIERPSAQGQDSLSQRGLSLNADGSSERILSAYQSFVEKEMLAIRKKAEANGTFMKAPNGKPSNLTERQWLTVRTKAFKAWFGDWENAPANASKVVDENGEPKVMYHGSPTAGIREFKMGQALYGEGAFFTSSPEEAIEEYTGLSVDDFEDMDEMDAAAVERGLLYEVFLNIRDEQRYYERHGGVMHARAIAPNEIKSATDNRGTFDGSNADINFSIQESALPDRFAGHPLAERMSNFMRTEARRYERTLSKGAPEDAATNAIFATQSIIHALDKYVRNGEFRLPREAMVRLKHMRALIEKYAQMMKSGKVRSFGKIDKAEQSELLAAMAEAAADIDMDAIDAMTPEEFEALRTEVEAELMPELYRKHARTLADQVAKGTYTTPAETAKRMKALAQAAETGFTNQELTAEDLQESGYNSQPDASTRQTVLKEYAKAKLAELENAEEANRKEFEHDKAQTLSALHRIMSEGRLADNTTLGAVEQRQLTDMVQAEAQDAIEKKARDREFKQTAAKIQQDNKARNERMVRVAATGRIGELLRDMLNETADIVEAYLKSELLKKMERITKGVKIKRTPSKTLKGKMGAAEYRRMDAIVELMEMSVRAKDNALGEIENARRILNESKGEIPEAAEGSLLREIINNLNEQGISVSVDMLNIELNNREADINIFANLDGMDYAKALNAARGLAGLIYFGRTAWQMKQAAEYERIKAFLDYFYEHTDSELGTSQAIDKGKKMKLSNIFNSSMNDAQLLFALAGHEGLRPVMDEMRRNLAMAQDARNLHIKSITNQIYATYARLIGMKPQTEAGYTDKQLREASNKFSMEFEKWNETGKPNVVREWIDNDGVLKKQEMELSRLQALDLILTYRQQHYQPNADKHGYTEAVLNKLEEYCGTRLMAMGEAFKRTIQNDGTAQVYEERTGIPMYKDPSYWPGSININTINLTSEEPLVNPYNPAGTYNRLKQRVKHTNEAKYQNAFEKWKHAIAEGANYIYLYPITNTLNRMLAHREFANRLHGLIGPDLFSQLRLMLNVLDSSTWQETALRDEANNWAASLLKATAPAVLAYNPGTMARQLSAINNYAMLPGIRISRLPALIALIKQDKSAIKLSDIMQLDSFKARYRDNAEVNDMLGLGANAKFSTYNKWAKEGMNIIDRLDIWSNAVSACLYYNMLYEQMQEKNQGAANPLSEEEIRNICEQNVAQLLRLVAQPLEKANKSAMYWKYGNTWMGSIFLYMSTEMVNKTGMLRATYIKNKAEGMPFHKNAWQLMYKMGLGLGGMTFLIEAGLFLLLSGDLPDDEKEWLAAAFSLAIYSAFGQYLSRIPFIGSVTDYYLSPYGQYNTNKNQQQNPALSIDKTSAKLLKMMSDNKHYSASEWQVAYTRFVRDLTAVSGLASGLVPQAQWISTTTATLQSLSAAMNTVYPVARSVQMDSWMRDITPDWYKPKKTKKRTKSALEEALTPEPEKKKRKSK